MASPRYISTDFGLDLAGQNLSDDHLSEVAERFQRLKEKSGKGVFTIDLSLNRFTLLVVDTFVPFLKKDPELRIVINDNNFNFEELRRHFELKDDAVELLRLLRTGRVHFSSTLLHLLTESVLTRQMDKVTKLSEQVGNLQSWSKKANFAIEDEVNSFMRKHFQALGYDIGPLFPGTRLAGAAMLSSATHPKDLYSFDSAYFLEKGEEKLVLLGEVKHSLVVKDVRDLDSKVGLFNKRMEKIHAGEMPRGSARFNSQNEALKVFQGAQVRAFVATVYVQPEALKNAAEKGFDIVLPGGARFEIVSANDAEAVARAWSANAPAKLQDVGDEC